MSKMFNVFRESAYALEEADDRLLTEKAQARVVCGRLFLDWNSVLRKCEIVHAGGSAWVLVSWFAQSVD